MTGIKSHRAFENPLATSETVARAEAVLASHGIGSLENTRKGKPTPPPGNTRRSSRCAQSERGV